jgi:hypothetical protein
MWNEELLAELKTEPADEKLRKCKSNWPRHVTGMNKKGMSKIMLYNGPYGRRRLGRPMKRLLDEAKTDLSRPSE